MPADLDLAALDALFKAATPGPWCTIPYGEKGDGGVQIGVAYGPDDQDCTTPLTGHLPECDENGEPIDYYFDSMVADIECCRSNSEASPGADAALIAALHNAWPSLRRDLEIGRAAVEVIEAEAKEREAQRAYDSHALGEHEQNSPRQEAARAWAVASRGLNAARARLRALREDGDAG